MFSSSRAVTSAVIVWKNSKNKYIKHLKNTPPVLFRRRVLLYLLMQDEHQHHSGANQTLSPSRNLQTTSFRLVSTMRGNGYADKDIPVELLLQIWR